MSKFSIEIDEINHEIARLKTDHLQLMKDFNSVKDEVKERRKKMLHKRTRLFGQVILD